MDNNCAGVRGLERLTYLRARRFIDERPAVIVPLGGCEPLGGLGALGAESACAAGVAKELAALCGVLVAPAVPFGCSTPFMAFAGAAGLKPRTFVNMLCDILHAYIFQGVEKIFLVSAAPFNKVPAAEAAKRLMAAHPSVRVLFFDINTILIGNIDSGGGGGIRAGGEGGVNVNVGGSLRINNNNTGNNSRIKNNDADFDRDDALLLSIYAYLRQEAFDGVDSIAPKNVGEERYRAWKKRGMDPQKLRKLFPDGLLLRPDVDIKSEISMERGKERFERIVELLRKEIDTVL